MLLTLYRRFRYFLIFLYIVIFLGSWSIAPDLLVVLRNTLKLVISIFLIYNFNRFNKNSPKTVSTLTREIAFDSGVILLTSFTIDSIIELYKQYIDVSSRVIRDVHNIIV